MVPKSTKGVGKTSVSNRVGYIFFMWLFFGAPASFFSSEFDSQVVDASFSHFVMSF